MRNVEVEFVRTDAAKRHSGSCKNLGLTATNRLLGSLDQRTLFCYGV